MQMLILFLKDIFTAAKVIVEPSLIFNVDDTELELKNCLGREPLKSINLYLQLHRLKGKKQYLPVVIMKKKIDKLNLRR